ncbi:MAG: hypothetical protein ACTIKO_05805, partial [Psychrobacter sp.]
VKLYHIKLGLVVEAKTNEIKYYQNTGVIIYMLYKLSGLYVAVQDAQIYGENGIKKIGGVSKSMLRK